MDTNEISASLNVDNRWYLDTYLNGYLTGGHLLWRHLWVVQSGVHETTTAPVKMSLIKYFSIFQT